MRSGDFRLLFAGLLCGWAVTPIQFVVQIFWLQESVSDDARIVLVGLIGSMRGAGTIAFGLYAGALADRFDRRTVLIWTQTLTAALHLGVVAVMLVGPNSVTLPLFFGLIMLSTATFAADLPIRQALVPDIVGPELAAGAIALCIAAIHLAEPPSLVATGFLIDGLGFAATYALATVGNVAAMLTLLAVRHRPQQGARGPQVRGSRRTLRDIGDALAYCREHPTVLWVLGLTTTVMLLAFPAVANLGPTWITTVLGQSFRNFGFIATGWSAAAFVTSLVLVRFAKGGRELPLLAGSSLLFAGSFVVFSVPSVPFAVVGNVGLGGALAMMQISATSIIHGIVPNEIRARMMTLLYLSLGLAQLLTLPTAVAGELLSLETLFLVLSVSSVAVTASMAFATLRVWRPAPAAAKPGERH